MPGLSQVIHHQDNYTERMHCIVSYISFHCSHQNVFGHFQYPNTGWNWQWFHMNDARDNGWRFTCSLHAKPVWEITKSFLHLLLRILLELKKLTDVSESFCEFSLISWVLSVEMTVWFQNQDRWVYIVMSGRCLKLLRRLLVSKLNKSALIWSCLACPHWTCTKY